MDTVLHTHVFLYNIFVHKENIMKYQKYIKYQNISCLYGHLTHFVSGNGIIAITSRYDYTYFPGILQYIYGYVPTQDQYLWFVVILWPASGVLNPLIFLLGTSCRRIGYVR
jgi:hypothetical protein